MNNKSRITAALLAFFLGTFGAQYFYMNNYVRGIVRLIFSFTGVSGILGVAEGIKWFFESDEEFAQHWTKSE